MVYLQYDSCHHLIVWSYTTNFYIFPILRVFYKNIIIYSLVTLCCIVVIFQLVQLGYRSKSWTLNRKINIAFIGDSHIEQSISDEAQYSILKFAQSGDNYIYTYTKLQKLLNDNPSIDTVVLGIDFHNIDKTSEEWYTSQSYINFKFPKLYPYMKAKEVRKLVGFYPWGYCKAISNLFSIQDLITDDDFVKVYGSYQISSDTISKDSLLVKPKHNYKEVPSATQFEYLGKIRELCQSKGVKLIFLTCPIHSNTYKSGVLDGLITGYAKQYQIQYLNLREMAMEDNYFADKFHINRAGSKYFTEQLLKLLRKN